MSELVLNMIGLLLNISGAVLMFVGSSKTDSKIYLYMNSDKDMLSKRDRSSNKKLRCGMALLFLGFLVQLVALLLNSI